MSEFRPNRKQSARLSAGTERALNRARKLRTDMSVPETKLWMKLRRQQLRGLKFRRQHPVPPYIVDFYCHEAELAVELDGRQHVHQVEEDRSRDRFLGAKGIDVLRISVSDFERSLPRTLERIADRAQARIKQLKATALQAQGGPVAAVATEPPPPAAPAPPPPPHAWEEGE